jgi:hypothetical protein
VWVLTKTVRNYGVIGMQTGGKYKQKFVLHENDFLNPEVML